MLASMYAAYVTCKLILHEDDLYYVRCWGRKDLMESVVKELVQVDKLGGYCTPYNHEETVTHTDFVAVCE